MTTADYDFINLKVNYNKLDEMFGNSEPAYGYFRSKVKEVDGIFDCSSEREMLLLYTTYMLRRFKREIGEPEFLTTTEVVLGIYYFCGEQKFNEYFFSEDKC